MMTDRIDTGVPRLLAGQGEACPAVQPENDNIVPIGAASAGLVDAAIVLAGGHGANVTLRLDPARHMRLRLACALGGRSAQAILAEALDAYLGAIPGIDRLTAGAIADGGGAAGTGRGTER